MDLNLWKINKHDHNKLKEYDGFIVTRFPPEPSGYLHIGHIKAIFINYVIAKKYNGKILLRFDDTNPITESEEYQLSIMEDIQKLGIVFDNISFSSDYFRKLIEYADFLVDQGLAYVDNTNKDLLKEQKQNGIESINRNNTIEKNKEIWVKLKNGEIQDFVLRIKIDMKHKNKCMRDPVIYRYIPKDHQRTKDIFKVYPSYDFSCPILDSIEEITHVYRSTEFSDRDEQGITILNMLGLRVPNYSSYGKMTFQNVLMKKRKIKEKINEGGLEGWDDPRLFTIRGVLRKGINLEALKIYVAGLGFSKNVVNMTPDTLLSINKKYVDKLATRFNAIFINNMENINVLQENGIYEDFLISKEVARFIRSPNLGTRDMIYSSKIIIDKDELEESDIGTEITLINWGNMFVLKENNIYVLKENLKGDFKTTKKKLSWIPNINDKDKIKILIKTYNEDNISEKIYYGEPSMKYLKKGEYVQLFKMNYYICDKEIDENNIIVLIEI